MTIRDSQAIVDGLLALPFPREDTRVALTVGQQDREFPIELLTAVGEEPIPEHPIP